MDGDEILKSHDEDNSTQELEQLHKKNYFVMYRDNAGTVSNGDNTVSGLIMI